MGNLNLTKPQGDFFALLLDTTRKVANFSPPVTSDHSQKRRRGAGGRLFSPLFAIDTINIFARDSKKRHPDGSEEATIDLFHYGRPLWGAQIASGESLFEIMELAKQKLEGRGPSYLTALLDAEMSPICSNGEMFCNHFFKQEEDPTKKTLENAFLHGAGIILPDCFPGADLLIPIKLPDGKMTFFGIQVKNRVRDSYSCSLKDETIRSFSKAAKTLRPDMPFIGLTMALRREQYASEDQSVGLVHPSKPTGHNTRSTTSPSAEYNWPKKNKRILLLAVGLDETVYPGITSCKGEKSLDSEAVLPLLNRLLYCKPG